MTTSRDNQLEIDAYAKLTDIQNGDPQPQKDNANWIFDIYPATQAMVDRFQQTQPAIASMFGTDYHNYVETFWACPLFLHPGVACWPKAFIKNNLIAQPASSLIFTRLIAMFGSQWPQTLQAGTPVPGLDIKQRRPLSVHVKDIVVFRTVQRGLQQTGLTMNIVTDPMMGLDMRPGATIIDAKKLSFCANESCLELDKHAYKCSGCKVAYYCSRECQKTDWTKLHKHECKAQQEAHKLFPWKEEFDKDLAEKQA